MADRSGFDRPENNSPASDGVQTLTTRSSRRQSGGSRWDILTVFTRRVAELGYDETNFDAIAAELGISKGTIVHHFGTKDRILAALHESYMTRRLAELDYMLGKLDDPRGLIKALKAHSGRDFDTAVG